MISGIASRVDFAADVAAYCRHLMARRLKSILTLYRLMPYISTTITIPRASLSHTPFRPRRGGRAAPDGALIDITIYMQAYRSP
jgi:hypothetical protein